MPEMASCPIFQHGTMPQVQSPDRSKGLGAGGLAVLTDAVRFYTHAQPITSFQSQSHSRCGTAGAQPCTGRDGHR